MRLFNADGSSSEVSGNGVRGLAAVRCRACVQDGRPVPASMVITTDAGVKQLEVLSSDAPPRRVPDGDGPPGRHQAATLDVGGAAVEAVVLRVGNPQCVVLETALDDERYRRLGAALEHHPCFPTAPTSSSRASSAPTACAS